MGMQASVYFYHFWKQNIGKLGSWWIFLHYFLYIKYILKDNIKTRKGEISTFPLIASFILIASFLLLASSLFIASLPPGRQGY